jgi:hypothetical protein
MSSQGLLRIPESLFFCILNRLVTLKYYSCKTPIPLLGAFGKLKKATVSFFMSMLLSDSPHGKLGSH